MRKVIYIIFVFFLCRVSFAEDAVSSGKASPEASRDALARSIEEAIKSAVKDIQAENAREQETNARELSVKLVAALDEWFAQVKELKTKELNKLQHHDWSELKKFPSPLPYDYYLKNFSYTITSNDISLTNSVVNPYKAFVEIDEKLYIEGYHSSDAAYLDQYRFTVLTPIELQMEYRDNMFTVVDTKYGQPVMERGWKK